MDNYLIDFHCNFSDIQIVRIRINGREKCVRTAETYLCAKKRFINFLGHDIALSQMNGRC